MLQREVYRTKVGAQGVGVGVGQGHISFGLGKDKQGVTGLGSNVLENPDIQKADKGGDLFPARALVLGVVLT